MIRMKIDIVDEITIMRKENERLKKRLDRIEVLFNQAQNMVDLIKMDLVDIRRLVETTESDMKRGSVQ